MSEEQYKEFVQYFMAKEKLGIPFGLSDLYEKARELKLPIPQFDRNFNFQKWIGPDNKEVKDLPRLKKRFECYGHANMSDACAQCPVNEERVKETVERGNNMNVDALLGRIGLALKRTGAFSDVQISDILIIVETILKEVSE